MFEKNELYTTSSGSNNNGSYNPANSNSGNSGLSVEDMRQALLDMMRRKDVFERENHSLRELLRQEKEKSEKLQMELDKTQGKKLRFAPLTCTYEVSSAKLLFQFFYVLR